MQLVSVCLANVFFIAVSSNIASAMSSLTVPRSFVVLIGDRVEMTCNVPGGDLTTWTYTAWNNSTVTNIYLGKDIVTSMRSKYKIDKNISGQHNLIIDSVDFTYAGRYRFSAAIQKTLWEDIQLTVLGSRPVCAVNTTEAHVDGKERTHLTIWCSISYTGNGFPVFNWTKSNAEKNIAANTTTSGFSRGPFSNTSSIIEQLPVSDDGVTLQCQITFQMPNTSQRVYVYTWNYTLPYGPKNLRIVEYEDRLECSADGYPTPTYRWTNFQRSRSTYGPVYTLNRTTVNEHTFECTATNTFASERKNHTIKGPATPGVSDVLITALAIGGSLLFLLTIVIIVSCAVHRTRLKDYSNDRPDVALNTDHSSHDDIVLSSVRSSNNIPKGDRLPGSKTSIQTTPSVDPCNQTPQQTDTSYCALNVQPSTTEESRIYCELRSCEQSSADYVNQACEEKLLKGKKSKRDDSRGTGSAVLSPISHQPNRLLSDASVKLTSTTLPTNEHKNSQRLAATSADYCALGDRSAAAQEPQLYCELRLNDQSGADYVNQ